MHQTARRTIGIAAFRARVTAIVWGVMLVAGCGRFTDVSAPDVVQRSSFANPAGAVTLWNGAVTTFYDSYGGPTQNFLGPFILVSGLVSDELTVAFSNTIFGSIDGLSMAEGGTVTARIDGTLLLTRIHILQAIAALEAYAPQERWRRGEAFALLGYTEMFLAEMFCSGVPFGNVVDFNPVVGGPLTTVEMFERARANFDSALVYSTDSTRLMHLARVGRGRALLNLDQVSSVAAAVSAVPTNFTFNSEHTAAVAPNHFFTLVNLQRQATVADLEGGNGQPYVSANDPRVATAAGGTGVDGVTPIRTWTRISSTASPNVLASGIEARLLEAEVALRANPSDAAPAGTGWLGIVNTLRATAITPALPALVDPGSYDARVNLLFRERAFWLFGTGHRHGDMRRLARQYSRAANTVFPTGTYKYGATYGANVNLPLDYTETRRNPLMGGKACLNRNP